MRETDAVWRTLVDASLEGRRQWKNAGDLACFVDQGRITKQQNAVDQIDRRAIGVRAGS